MKFLKWGALFLGLILLVVGIRNTGSWWAWVAWFIVGLILSTPALIVAMTLIRFVDWSLAGAWNFLPQSLSRAIVIVVTLIGQAIGCLAVFLGFFAGKLGLLMITGDPDNVDDEMPLFCGMAVVGLICGSSLVVLSKKVRQRLAPPLIAADNRPPVLYLRSFSDDKRAGRLPTGAAFAPIPIHTATEEQQLSMVLSQLGPTIAADRPGAILPDLGFQRLTFSDYDWPREIRALINDASLVVLRLGKTDSLRDELEWSLNLLKSEPHRLVILLPVDAVILEEFWPLLERATGHSIPSYVPGRLSAKSETGGVLFFDQYWKPQVVTFRHRRWPPGRGISSEIEQAMRPVLSRHGVKSGSGVRSARWRRALAFLIDMGLVGLTILAVAISVKGDTAKVLSLFLVPAVYFIGMELTPWRATLGKRLLSLKVQMRSGVPLSGYLTFCRIFLLWFETLTYGYIIPLLVVLWIGQPIRDIVLRATVVYAPRKTGGGANSDRALFRECARPDALPDFNQTDIP